ncbi:type II toxin-antitoxin system CcdA family antitoxin [Propionivibrio sp.]|uniref:type II toxin-antitoxin system CcdA family antitoxin n=1 Tax=Propionivibrio sp. TaxID=2212460 RepID=UPI002629DA62|nr:type II toxin-antitoxin system CcdA family antitoxin [Propionivibrio sp.]
MRTTILATNSTRKAANVTLAESLLSEAKALRINVSKAAEEGLTRAVAQKRAALWLEANRSAIDSSNRFVEQHGLPLSSYQQF